MIVGVITAMQGEYDQVAQLLSNVVQHEQHHFAYMEGSLGQNRVVLTRSGIGKVNAASAAMDLIARFDPNCVISTGVAGGIDETLSVMDVVVSQTLVYHDVWCGDGNDYGQVQGLPTYFMGNSTLVDIAQGDNIHKGLICTGDKFICNKDELLKIKSDFPHALAVDMESTAIAQVCHIYQKPFVSMRIISDTPYKENNFEAYENFWKTIADNSFEATKRYIESLPEKL